MARLEEIAAPTFRSDGIEDDEPWLIIEPDGPRLAGDVLNGAYALGNRRLYVTTTAHSSGETVAFHLVDSANRVIEQATFGATLALTMGHLRDLGVATPNALSFRFFDEAPVLLQVRENAALRMPVFSPYSPISYSGTPWHGHFAFRNV